MAFFTGILWRLAVLTPGVISVDNPNFRYNVTCAENIRADAKGFDVALRGMLIDLNRGAVFTISRDPGLHSTWAKSVDGTRLCYSAIISATWTGPSLAGHVNVCGVDAYVAVASIFRSCHDTKTGNVGGM
jgi:hypothetical protein